MSILPIIVVGAGEHAGVVVDALLASGKPVKGSVDSATHLQGTSLCGVPVLGGDEVLDRISCADAVLVNGIGSIGDPTVRTRVQKHLESLGWKFVGVIHPSAIVSPFARVAPDAQILARAVVQPHASISEGCIVNTGAIIEHHVSLGAWSHAAPGSVICGCVRLGESCHVGAGAIVKQGVRLGPSTLVGVGAVVLKPFEGNGALVGNPAKKLEK